MLSDASENSVKQALAEEDRKVAVSNIPLHDTSPSVCISLGLLIEDLQ